MTDAQRTALAAVSLLLATPLVVANYQRVNGGLILGAAMAALAVYHLVRAGGER